MPHDVFISHSSKDKAVADAVCTALETSGIKCWIAPRNINFGQEWPEAIVNAVTSSRAMVLVFSKNANHSKDVAKETLLAMNLNIDVFPIKIEDAEPTGTMQYYLSDRKWLNATDQPVKEKTKELLELIRPLIPNETVNSSQTPAAAMAEPEEHQLKSEKFNLTALFRKTKYFISAKPVLAVFLATACLLLLIGAIGILSTDHEKARGNDSDSQAFPAALTDHEDYDLKISELGYDTIYVIDNINGAIPLADLEIGSRVVDPSWLWQFRTGANYSYTEGDRTKPVVWIVAAKDHFDNMEPHVTLLTDELIGKYAFDISFGGGGCHWGNSGTISATHGLRPWLNSTGIHAGDGFYHTFSDSFKSGVVTTPVPNREFMYGTFYVTYDRVFIPSSNELGDPKKLYSYEIGITYPYFTNATNEDRVSKLKQRNQNYWTRSTEEDSKSWPWTSNRVRFVSNEGDFNKFSAPNIQAAVRPVVNLKSNTLVYLVSVASD